MPIDKGKQAWVGNISSGMTEQEVIDYVSEGLPSHISPPFKAVLRPSMGASTGRCFAFLSWKDAEHAAYFRDHAAITWPDGRYALIKTIASSHASFFFLLLVMFSVVWVCMVCFVFFVGFICFALQTHMFRVLLCFCAAHRCMLCFAFLFRDI